MATGDVPCMPGYVFVLIRFDLSRVDACRNALMKNFSLHKSYAGSVAGVSRRFQPLAGDWPRDKGVAILSFCNLKEALLWKDSVPEIRQHDWLDWVDLIIVPVRCIPCEGFRFVQLLDLKVFDCEKFCEWVTEMNALTECLSVVSTAVVACQGAQWVKGSWKPGYLQLNFWSGYEEYEKFYCSELYQKWRNANCAFADIKTCVFELEPLCFRFCCDTF